MAKLKSRYVCQACGSEQHRWQGQCPDCAEWNTLVQEASAPTVFSAKHDLRSGGRAVELVGLDAVVALPGPDADRDRGVRSGDWGRDRTGIGDAAGRRPGDRQIDAAVAGGGDAGSVGAQGCLCLRRRSGRPGSAARHPAGAGRGAGAAGRGHVRPRHTGDGQWWRAARTAGDRTQFRRCTATSSRARRGPSAR